MSDGNYTQHPHYPQILVPVEEFWKDVPRYEDYYQGSTWGRVRSVTRTVIGKDGRRQFWESKQLKLMPHNAGYVHVCLCKNSKYEDFLVHSLILQTFVGPCPTGMEACHGDDKKCHNHLLNLRWDTRRNNSKDRLYNGRSRKLTKEQVEEIRWKYSTGCYTQQLLGDMYGVAQTMIGHIVHNKMWVLDR